MTEDYFVRIEDARYTEAKRLEVARRVLLCSAAYLTLKDVRERKEQLTHQLKSQTDTLAKSFHQLEKLLPHQELLSEEEVPEPTISHRESKSSSVGTSTNKMEKLQEALALIEKKIESLNL